MARVRDRRRSDQLFEPPKRFDAPDGYLCGSHPEWRQTRRPAGHSVDQVRAGYQSKDGKGDRPGDSADAARHCRRGDRMIRRRKLITLLGGAAGACPLGAGAQQEGERMRRVGVLLPAASDDREFQARLRAFLRGLRQLGWIDGHNVSIDMRWAAEYGDLRRHAEELVARSPDALMAFTAQ